MPAVEATKCSLRLRVLLLVSARVHYVFLVWIQVDALSEWMWREAAFALFCCFGDVGTQHAKHTSMKSVTILSKITPLIDAFVMASSDGHVLCQSLFKLKYDRQTG
jgi:hypothetical protein